jgi:Helix-turn-helix domain/RodZ C-terminal domain
MADIGSTLREARMRARIDISEVEARTKIRAKYLRAIENEEWDLLPGPVYVRSFLRTYGEYLGLDWRMLIDEYKRRYEGPSDHELRPVTSPGRERGPRRPSVPPWLVIACVFVVIIVVLIVVGNNNNNKQTSTIGARTHKVHKHHRRHHRRAVALPATPTTVKLQLAATGTVYVCLVNGTGAKLIPGQIYTPGQTIPTETAPKLLLTLGNASVDMKVNGKVVKVAPSASSIGYLIQPSGTTSLPAAKQPRCA